jgi:hypothetical protein
MKIKEGFMLKQVCEEFMVVPVGAASVDFKSVIRLNETGAFLWNLLEKGATKEDMLKDILDEYDVSAEIASADIDTFILKLTDAGIID